VHRNRCSVADAGATTATAATKDNSRPQSFLILASVASRMNKRFSSELGTDAATVARHQNRNWNV